MPCWVLTPLNTTSIDNSMGWLTKLQKSLKFFHATTAAALFIFILKFTCHTPCFSHRSTRCKASPTRAPSTAKNTIPFIKHQLLQTAIHCKILSLSSPPPNTSRPIAKLDKAHCKSTNQSSNAEYILSATANFSNHFNNVEVWFHDSSP